jgi:alpha-amylase
MHVMGPLIESRRRVLAWAALSLSVVLLAACKTPPMFQPAPRLPDVDTSVVAPSPNDSALPAQWHRGAFMQVFVRAYQDSNGDGMGDLKGLTQRLDHLKDLGVRGLWLMPITPSADNDHGYATTDYRAIDPAYGTLADFDELLRQAHARGIGVIMDYVVNHSAAEHPLFVQARSSAKNPYRDWYVWSDTTPQGWDVLGKNPWYHAATQPWTWKGKWADLPKPAANAREHYFGTFGADLPDFNLRNPKVVDYHLSSLRFWLNRGVDGFRLDSVPHLVENDAKNWIDQRESRQLTALFAQTIKSYPNRYVVCEATQEPQAYGDDSVCGAAFAFDLHEHFVKAAKGDAASVSKLADYHRRGASSMAHFVANHDRFTGGRLWDQVGGDIAAYKLAAASYLLLPGTPFIYYGEEIGQGGVTALAGDDAWRAPMSWTPDNALAGFTVGKPFRPNAPNLAKHNAENERVDGESIHAFYKDLISLRNRRPSLALGTYDNAFTNRLVLGFQRAHGNERTLVLVNHGRTRAEVEVTGLPRRARMAPIYPRRAGASYVAEVVLADAAGKLTISVPPRSIRLFDVEMRQ